MVAGLKQPRCTRACVSDNIITEPRHVEACDGPDVAIGDGHLRHSYARCRVAKAEAARLARTRPEVGRLTLSTERSSQHNPGEAASLEASWVI